MSAGALIKTALRQGAAAFAVLAYLTLVGLPARLAESALSVFSALAAALFFLMLRRAPSAGVGTSIVQGMLGGLVLGMCTVGMVGGLAALVGSGVRVQQVLDKMTPPNLAAWFGVPPIAITRSQLGALELLRPALALALAGGVGGALAAISRARLSLSLSDALRWAAIALPFLLFGLVIAMGDAGFPLGGSNRGTLRLLLAMLAIASGMFALRATRAGLEQRGVAGALLIGVAALPFTLDQFQNAVMGIVFIFVMMGLGLNIVVGYAGLLDLGYVAFFAIGAYAYAFLSAPFSSPWFSQQLVQLGLPTTQPLLSFWQAIPLIMLLGALGGVMLGVPVLRLRGDYLAIVTLGFGEIIRLFMLNLADLTNGPRGLLNIAAPTLFGYNLGNPRDIFILALVGSAVIAFVALRLERSRIGRAWMAMREDEEAAQAMGIHLVRAKLLAFAIGATFAALAGQLYAARQVNIFPDNFSLFVSIDALALIIVGGMGSIPGVVLGAIALKGLPEVLRGVDEYRIVTFAALLVIMMIVRPAGVLPTTRRRGE
ncbi:MAG: hypothetical protein NZ532_00010 [Thermoflexales bacterium]|nr:hypothetical protein [Thermoflexales bacterium]